MPTSDQLLKTGSDQFKQAGRMDVVVSPDFVKNTTQDMRVALKGFDPEAQSAVFKAVDRLESLGKPPAQSVSPAQRLQAEMNWEPLPAAPPPSPVSMNDVELVRKQLSGLRKSADASIRSAAKTAQEVLTQKQATLNPADVISGDALTYAKTIRDAVGNYGAGKRAATVQGKMNLAELNANSPVGALDSGTTGQALQRTMKQLARPVNNTNVPVARKLGFNDTEIGAITKAASGSKWTDTAELLDRLVPFNLGAIPAMAARQLGGMTTKGQVAGLDALVRSRSPMALQAARQSPRAASQLPAPTQRLLRSLLLADIAHNGGQQVSQPNAN
jgi:hypothetical protein